MVLEDKLTLKTENDTAAAAAKAAEAAQPGSVITLTGNLGAGKTTFARYFCSHFNIDRVTSPTFSLINEYEGDLKIFHLDFYRINSVEELYDIGIEEYLNDPDSICLIEWAEMFPEVLPTERIEITIDFDATNTRVLTINETK